MARFISIARVERVVGKGGARKGRTGERRVDTSNLSWTEAKLLGNWLEHVGRSARSRR